MADATFDAPYRQIVTPQPPRATPRQAPIRAREMLALLGLVLAVDTATWVDLGPMWGQHFALGGYGGAIVFVAVPIALVVAAPRWRRSWRLAVVAMSIGLLALRTAIVPVPATTVAWLLLVAAMPLALRSRQASMLEVGRSALRTVLGAPLRARAIVPTIGRVGVTRATLVAATIPAVVAIAFALVLAAANPVLSSGLASALGWVARLPYPTPARVACAAVVAALGLLAMRPSPALRVDDETARAIAGASSVEHAVARNTLVLVNALFLAYHALDATYLWSGQPPAGMTTQAYAHHGALWLTIALAMLTAVVCVLFRGPLAHDAGARTARTLAYVWIAQGLVLALGTYRRIAIHVAHTGLSDLRIVGVTGTTLVVAGVVLVAEKLRAKRSGRWLVRRQLDALALAFVGYALLPTYWISAQLDVARITAGERGPLIHLAALAGHVESATVLLPLLDHPDPRVREGVAAMLETETACLGCELASWTSWRDADLSSPAVYEELVGAAGRIDAARDGADSFEARRALRRLGEAAAEDATDAELDAIAPAARARPYAPQCPTRSHHFVQ